MLDSFFYSIAYAQSLIACPDGTMADPAIGCVAIPSNVISPESSLLNLILKIANGALMAAGGLAVIFLIIGAIRYAAATGDPDRIEQAKRTMIWSVAGLLVSFLASGIIQFILNTIK